MVKRINKMFIGRSKRIEKYTSAYKRLSWFSHYFKVKASLKLK